MLTPQGRGALSEAVVEAMRAGKASHLADPPEPDSAEDAQLTLWVLYEQHYRGFEDVSGELEWDPHLISVRRDLERSFEQTLRSRVPEIPEPGDFAEKFFAFVSDHDGPSVAAYVQRKATEDQVRELLRHRSIYHLKESDHTTWVIPRLSDRVKAAVMELQFDEYGDGDPNRLHAHLFTLGLQDSGLDSTYGAYINEAPLEVLEENNAMSLFGLNRRLRGASLGFLAAFEATSSSPSRRMAAGLERLGFPESMIGYYTEHVEADAVHEQLAVRTICGALMEEEPDLHDDIYLGAWTSLDLEDRYAERMLSQWTA